MDTLKSILVFSRIVEFGSLTAAAADMNISPAMVSKHLKHLESYVGARLLQRTTRSLRLTDEGRLYYEHCQTALNKMDEFRSMLGSGKNDPRGTLRIAVPPLAEVAHLQHVIPAYVRRHPHVKLDMVFTDGIPNLIEEGFDLALHIAETLPNSSMIARRLTPIDHVICASTEYLEAAGRPVTAEDLRHHLVLTHANSGGECSLSKGGEKINVKLERYMFLDSRLLARRLAQDGLGIAILPTEIITESLKCGRLEVLLPDYDLPERYLHVIYPSRNHLSAKVRTFIDLFATAFKRPPAEAGTVAFSQSSTFQDSPLPVQHEYGAATVTACGVLVS